METNKEIIEKKLIEIIDFSKKEFGEYKKELIGFRVICRFDSFSKHDPIYQFEELKNFIDSKGNLEISDNDLKNLLTFINKSEWHIYDCEDNYTSIYKVYKEINLGWRKTLTEIFNEVVSNQNTQ